MIFLDLITMSSDTESDWSDVDEIFGDERNIESTLCLFCESRLPSIEDCFLHVQKVHQVDIKSLICDFNLDFYSYIKFVNYTRKNCLEPCNVKELSMDSFMSDEFLKPVVSGDMMLQFDIDSYLENNKATGKNINNTEIEKKLLVAEERANLAEEFLERTIDDLNNCRTKLQSLLLKESSVVSDVESHSVDENIGYFSSYAHYGIHEEMLKDTTRTRAYQQFILNNPKVFEGCSVLDVGCGTAILSMFAANAGASKVTGVDNSEIAYHAMDIVKENGLESLISISKGKAEDLCVKEKFDIIISEWMGYFLLFESMLDTVIYCRDHYLAENGCIYPDKCNIQLVAMDDHQLYENKVKYWDNVYGFKMSSLKSNVFEEPLIDIADHKHYISKPVKVKHLDLMTISVSDLDFDETFQLVVTRDAVCSSILGYFDISFGEESEKIPNPVSFSTSPECNPTHWKQAIFLLKEPFHCKTGEVVRGRIFCKKNKKDNRALDIALIFYGENDNIKFRQHYVIS